MTLLGTFPQQPNEILDYKVDFSEWFAGRSDTPVSHTAEAQTGINIVSSALTGTVVRLVLSGGADGNKYKVTVRITTSDGIVKEADFAVRVRET